MFYGILRIIFWGVIFTLIFVNMGKRKLIQTKIIVVIFWGLAVIICSISFLIPVENYVLSFESPRSVLKYYQGGTVDDVIQGNGSSMVIYSKGSSSGGHFIVPKSTKGYKIPSLFSVKKVLHKFNKDGNFDVYNVSGTNDYYVVGTIITKENEINVVDSNNEQVRNIIAEIGNADIKTILLFSFVENFTDEYYLLINGTKVSIGK